MTVMTQLWQSDAVQNSSNHHVKLKIEKAMTLSTAEAKK
jgi:hypothetical protein